MPVVNPIFSVEIPVENVLAVIIPVVFTLAVVVNPVAVVAVPEKVVAVIIPALKFPLSSRATIVLAVLRCVASDVTVNVTAVPVA